MILLYFIDFVLSLDDIEKRNLLSRNKRYYGEWEYTGSTVLKDDFIYLYDQQPKSVGGFYFSQRLPNDSWNSTISFDFDKESIVSKTAIWITKDYGPEGYIFGGPSSFLDAALFITFQNNSFKIEIKESITKQNTKQAHIVNSQLIKTDNTTLLIKLQEYNDLLSVFAENNNIIYNISMNSIKYTVNKPWFGITSMSSDDNSSLRINYIEFSSNYSLNFPILMDKINIPKITITNPKNDEKNTTINEILNHIELFYDKVNNITTTTYISKFISQKLINVSDIWQTRTNSMIREVPKLAQSINETLNSSYAEISNVQTELHEELLDLIKEVQNVTAKLYYSIIFDNDIEDNVSKHAENTEGKGLIKLLFYITIVEVIASIIISIWKLFSISKHR